MRQNGLDRVRIGEICDHPQGAAAQRALMIAEGKSMEEEVS
jgi:hypothetical protein